MRTSRCDVLKLSGVGLGAITGASTVSAAGAGTDCVGGGGGTGTAPYPPKTFGYTVTDWQVKLQGMNGSGDEAWFEWGLEDSDFPNDTELREPDQYALFNGHPIGVQSGTNYEYRVLSYNGYGSSVGITRTFTP